MLYFNGTTNIASFMINKIIRNLTFAVRVIVFETFLLALLRITMNDIKHNIAASDSHLMISTSRFFINSVHRH